MAITIDTTNKQTAETAAGGATSLTIPNFLVAPTTTPDSAIVLCASLGSDATISGITWNGVAFTQVGTQANSTLCRADIWRLTSPTAGVTSNIVITFSGSVRAVATAFTLDEIFATTPFDAAMGATGNSMDATVTYTNGADDDWAVLCIAKRDSTESNLSPGTSSVERGEAATDDGTAANNVVHHCATEPLTSGSQVLNGTWITNSREWAILAASANWAKATYQWKGAHQATLTGFATVMDFNGTYDITRSALKDYGGLMTLDTDGVIAALDDARLLKA